MRAGKTPPMAVVAAAAIALGGCPSPERDDAPTEARPASASLQVSAETIRTEDSTVLLEIDDVPETIRVDHDTQFGAASRFTEASPSPDGEWLAVATSSAVHDAVWLVHTRGRAPRAAAFQYGGSLALGPWSNPGRHIVVIHEGPAGDRTLSVVDRERLGQTVRESIIPVRTPDHDDLPPEERIYQDAGWQNGLLAFRLTGQGWLFDPETGEVQRGN